MARTETTRPLFEDTDLTEPDELPLDASAPSETETATFALGCFWGPDARFGVIPGVVRTRVGYAGGTKENPTYHDLGKYVETVQVDYDPEQVTYEDLLDLFWGSHNPTLEIPKRQYQSIAFYHSEKQRALIEDTKEREAEKRGEIHTEVAPLSTFYLAEAYHQKHDLRHHSTLADELEVVYSPEEVINSTVAARVNGYVAGDGSPAQLADEIDEFGLSTAATRRLEKIVSRRS